jgi:hypothetical protein
MRARRCRGRPVTPARGRVLGDGRPSSGDFSDPTLIRKSSEVPDDLSRALSARASPFREPTSYLPLSDRLMRVTMSSQACSSSAG